MSRKLIAGEILWPLVFSFSARLAALFHGMDGCIRQGWWGDNDMNRAVWRDYCPAGGLRCAVAGNRPLPR